MDTNSIYKEFAQRLAGLRKSRGLSQQALAEALSVTRQAVSNWERGQTVPDLGMLERLCQVLAVDWNRLCGGDTSFTPPPRRSRLPTAVLAAGAALALTLAVLLPQRPAPEFQPPAYTGLRGEVLRSHLTTVVEPGPYGLRKTAARELADLLEALDAEPGPVSLTPELREAFSLAGEACEFRFLPAYEDGTFLDTWDAVLTWCWRGLHRNGLPTTEQVDQWLTAWFAAPPQSHRSTEHFTLKDGAYQPDSAYSGICVYAVEALDRLEDGSFQARLRLTETSGTGEKLPQRIADLTFTASDGQICFSAVAWNS